MAETRNGEFVCAYCGKTFITAEELKADFLTNHRGASPPEPEGHIRLTVNGSEYQLRVEPNETLYQVIHDTLGLTGVKQFCDRGACGSCTVIMDGQAVLSCMLLAIECNGRHIETAEGVADAGHPLIESYVKHHAMQCGYCTPGFVTTSKALLDANSNPSEADIKQALSGNLCRCGTYSQHVKAVQEAAETILFRKP